MAAIAAYQFGFVPEAKDKSQHAGWPSALGDTDRFPLGGAIQQLGEAGLCLKGPNDMHRQGLQ
jgi:hypothetical protein